MKTLLYLIAILFCSVLTSCATDDNNYANFRNGYFQRRFFDTIEIAKDSFVVNAVYIYSKSVAVEKVNSFTIK